MSLKAYQQASVRAEDPRETEYRLFGVVIRSLMDVKALGRNDLGAMASVLDWNKNIWEALAADCASDKNAHNDSLRAGIISLSIFVERYSKQVLLESADIDPLIDINRTVMQGLAPAPTRVATQGSQDTSASALAAQGQ